MTTPILPIGLADPADALLGKALLPTAGVGRPGGSFAQMLVSGVDDVDRKLAKAEAMAKAFALDDSVPLHQVTYAFEQARLSMELMLQVRTRLVDSFQEFTRMQL